MANITYTFDTTGEVPTQGFNLSRITIAASSNAPFILFNDTDYAISYEFNRDSGTTTVFMEVLTAATHGTRSDTEDAFANDGVAKRLVLASQEAVFGTVTNTTASTTAAFSVHTNIADRVPAIMHGTSGADGQNLRLFRGTEVANA